MANFNKKVICLFKKEREQLIKEAQRRGLTYENTEQAIAEIIWKDAYEAGVNEAKRSFTPNQITPTKMYRFYDSYSGINYRISINKEQANAIQWVIDTLNDPAYELTEWNDDFVDVGKI